MQKVIKKNTGPESPEQEKASNREKGTGENEVKKQRLKVEQSLLVQFEGTKALLRLPFHFRHSRLAVISSYLHSIIATLQCTRRTN